MLLIDEPRDQRQVGAESGTGKHQRPKQHQAAAEKPECDHDADREDRRVGEKQIREHEDVEPYAGPRPAATAQSLPAQESLRRSAFATVSASMSLQGHKLYLLFTPSRAGPRPWRALEAALRGGVDLVQWRSKEPDDAGFRACRDLCQQHGVPIVVNDEVMLAIRGHARGAHVGQDDLPAEAARKLLGRLWLGVSTHDTTQIEAATRAGADYVGFGPCFPTATKGYEHGLDPAVIEAAAFACKLPLFAIGGIRPDNVRRLYGLGIRRIAVCSAILRADDPEAAAAELRAAL